MQQKLTDILIGTALAVTLYFISNLLIEPFISENLSNFLRKNPDSLFQKTPLAVLPFIFLFFLGKEKVATQNLSGFKSVFNSTLFLSISYAFVLFLLTQLLGSFLSWVIVPVLIASIIYAIVLSAVTAIFLMKS